MVFLYPNLSKYDGKDDHLIVVDHISAQAGIFCFMSEQQYLVPGVWIAATSSNPRREGVRAMAQQLSDSELITHSIAPDKKCGVYESDQDPPAVVALDKVLVVAVSLGLVPEEMVASLFAQAFDQQDIEFDRSWVERVIKLDPKEYDIDETSMVGIWASDVVTLVRKKSSDQDVELLKLDRKTDGKSRKRKKRIVAKDKQKMYQLYSKEDFEVIFRVAVAYWDNQGELAVESWEIRADFDKVSKKRIRRAYQKGGSAEYSGPRLDLAKMAIEGEAKNVQIRQIKDGEITGFEPVSLELVYMLVRQGIVPPHAFLEMLAK